MTRSPANSTGPSLRGGWYTSPANTQFHGHGCANCPLTEVLRAVHAAAQVLRLEFFVAGALARDIWLDYIYRVPVARLTRDIDVGIHVFSYLFINECLAAHLVGYGTNNVPNPP